MNKWKAISFALLAIALILAVEVYNTYVTYHLPKRGPIFTPDFAFVAKEPSYREDPLMGNYSFITNYGTVVEYEKNGSFVFSYVYINLTSAKPGDEFAVFMPVDPGTCLTWGLYTNPIFNFTIVNDTVFEHKGEEYLNFTITVIYAKNGYGGLYMKPAHSGMTTLLEPGSESSSIIPLGGDAYIFLNFSVVNSTTLELKFYIDKWLL